MESREKREIFGILFIHNKKYYFYDTNKNNILVLDKDLYRLISLLIMGDVSIYSDVRIANLFSKGYFHKSNIKKLSC